MAGGRVLIMDDEEMIRELAEEILGMAGYEVESALDGSQAIAAFKGAVERNRPFDLAILDLTIPDGIGGMEVAGTLLEISPGTKAIVSSGHSHDPVVSDYGRYGFHGVILKPYNVSAFTSEVRRVMEG